MKKLLLLFILFITFRTYAQHWETGAIITLHPSLGTRVSEIEKKEFSLFGDVADSVFDYAQFIKYNDSTFTVIIHNLNGQSSEKPISRAGLWVIYYQVDLIKPAPASEDKSPSKKDERYARFTQGLDMVSEILGYTVLWSVRILNVFTGGEWK